MSSPKIGVVVFLVVSLLLMQVNLGLASNGSISIQIVKTSPPQSGALSNSITGLAAWVIPISFGPAAAQALNLLIDTSKSDLWVADSTCRSAWCLNTAPATYNSALSPNIFFDTRQSATVSYFDGKLVSGTTTQDQLLITAPDLIGRQDFIRVTSASGFTGLDNGYSGMLGLAPGKNTRNRLSVMEKLAQDNLITSRIFSFRTAQGATSLDIGNVPAPVAPQTRLTYVPVATRGTWNFRASQLDLEFPGPITNNIARNVVFRIETLLPNIGIPAAQLRSIATRHFGATRNRLTGLYEFNCALAPNLIFTIGGQTYVIPSANFINQPVAPNTLCTLNIFESSNGWILGQQFLGVIDTVYDATNNRIGFFN